jgi:hypothetical protein
MLTKGEARRIAANIAKLGRYPLGPDLVQLLLGRLAAMGQGQRHPNRFLSKAYPTYCLGNQNMRIMRLMHFWIFCGRWRKGIQPSWKGLAPAVRGRTRKHIAREREDVYPGRPDHIEQTTKLVSGWWLGTNIANREKMRIIEKACEVDKLKLGHDISITLPNA